MIVKIRVQGNECFINRSNIEAKLPFEIVKKKTIPASSVIFPKRGAAIATNKKRLTTTWTAIDPNLIAILPGEKVNPLYLFYWFLTFDLTSIQAPGPTPQLNKKDVDPIKVPLPPLPEQKKIAYVLSTIQEAKEKTENVINSLNELKKSMMKHLFIYGPVSLEEDGKVKLKETEIGEIPEEWEVKDIGKYLIKTKQKDMRKTDIEFKYIDVSGISRDSLAIVDYTLCRGKEAPSRARKIVHTNDIIIATVRPTLKRISIVNEEFNNQICSTAFCVLRSNKDHLNFLYLYYAVQRDCFIEELGKIQRGASYPAVTDSDIKNQSIPIPPLSTQKQISQILSTIDSKIESEENKKNALNELFKSMLHNLMTGKVRVKNLDFDLEVN